MDWIEHLFIGAGIAEPERVIASLRRRKPVPRLHCIVFFTDRQRMEILPSCQLLHPRNRKRPGKIAGLAMGRGEALELVAFMAQTALAEGRNPALSQEWLEG